MTNLPISQGFILWDSGFAAPTSTNPHPRDSGSSPATTPLAVQAIVQPLGPWSSVSIAAPPSQPPGSVLLFLTVPLAAEGRVRANPLLSALAPNARFGPMAGRTSL